MASAPEHSLAKSGRKRLMIKFYHELLTSLQGEVSRAPTRTNTNKDKISDKRFVRSVWFVVKILMVFLYITSCLRKDAEDDGIVIAVSIPPQAWFVTEIAGDKAGALILVPPGQNPHSYEPTPRQIQSLTNAGAWILSGSEFEITLAPKISALFPNLQIVDGTKGVNFRQLEEHEHNDCDVCFENDRHTWLGREPAKILSAHVKDILCILDNENEEYYLERYKKLVYEITKFSMS